jgi:acetylornithine/succinyldiaminopimelate/putrescine aminotransferase
MSPPAPHFIAMEARFGAQNYQPLGVILSRGEGVWLWDTQGNPYLDCLSAYSAVNSVSVEGPQTLDGKIRKRSWKPHPAEPVHLTSLR